MKNGGYRPGAGRPRGSKNKTTVIEAEARSLLVNHILEKWKPIADTMISLALGKIKIVKIEGKYIRVYTRPPNFRAVKSIIETVIGKPKYEISSSVDVPQLEQLSNDIRTILERK